METLYSLLPWIGSVLVVYFVFMAWIISLQTLSELISFRFPFSGFYNPDDEEDMKILEEYYRKDNALNPVRGGAALIVTVLLVAFGSFAVYHLFKIFPAFALSSQPSWSMIISGIISAILWILVLSMSSDSSPNKYTGWKHVLVSGWTTIKWLSALAILWFVLHSVASNIASLV